MPGGTTIPTPQAPALSSAWTFGSTGVLVDEDEWRNLRLRHALALIPAAGLLGALAAAARSAPCELPVGPLLTVMGLPPKVDAQCDAALHAQLTLAVAAVGGVFWLAAWSMRTACYRLANWVQSFITTTLAKRRTIRTDEEQPLLPSEELAPTSRAIEALVVLLHIISIETLRLGALATGFSLLLAELAVRVGLGQDSHDELPDRGKGWKGISERDPRFSMALWVSLGWAAALSVVGSYQLLAQLDLYRPPNTGVLLPRTPTARAISSTAESRPPTLLERMASDSGPATATELLEGQESEAQGEGLTSAQQLAQARDALHNDVDVGIDDEEDEEDEEVEEDFQEQIRLREQRLLEATLGAPLPDVPVSLALLWRIDGILFSLGTTLVMGAALAGAQGPIVLTPYPATTPLSTPDYPPHVHPLLPDLSTYAPSLVALIVLHAAVSLTWHFGVPRAGFALVTYTSLLLALSLVAGGLALWGVLK